MQTNTIAFDPMPVKLKNIVTQAFEAESIRALKKKVTITRDIGEELVVFADMNMISTVLRNLISNAIKYAHTHGKIHISAFKLQDGKIEIAVSDNGTGIKSENLSKIFHIDSKFTIPGTENETGSALGLILCKEFVEKNAGEIRIESQYNLGTTVFFTLPEFAKQ